MSFSSGVFTINSSGQPVVTGTVISSGAFNALTADLATGLSTCMLKNGTQTATAGIPFFAGTVGLPGVTLATENTTGWYRIGANNWGFAVTGTKLLDLSSGAMSITGTLALSGAMTFSGAVSVLDSNFSIKDNVDPTKIAQFQASAITTATTRTYTLPDVTDTLVTLTATQTLTNKTLTAAVLGDSTATTQAAGDSTTKVATTAFVNSTALTLANGTTATTQTAGDSTTKVATTAFVQGQFVTGTAASATGTSIDFGSLPTWVRRITINFTAVSTNGTSNPLIQLGVAGTPETSGYLGTGMRASGSATAEANYTTGFGVTSASAANVLNGSIVISLLQLSSNTWACTGTLGGSNSSVMYWTGGSKPLAGTLNLIRITTVNGTDAYDAGTINILYE